MTRISKAPRNRPLARGIEALSRTEAFHARGQWAKKPHDWKVIPKKTRTNPRAPKVQPLGGKEKSTRTVKPKTPRFYPVEKPKRRLPSRKEKHHTPRVRRSLRPGTVVIILSGKFRGKRVVLLKVLKSGLLVVTGPFQVNGVPIRRLNPAYVIATSTRVDLSGFTLDNKFNDEYFARPKSTKDKKKTESEDQYFSTEKKKKEIKPERKEDQKAVDKKIIEVVDKTENLRSYLSARFSLTRHQYPHLLKF